ncbi:Spy/CpxP family protein refolding chaperone [Celerinatantimonas yamalensis]|uniref:Spy/CpxP family protein refolding chaperone n=1 Tax=Celerinatantimonas yamalensis TaxID=559956 RepID=A0ABW9G9K5_9GAMM
MKTSLRLALTASALALLFSTASFAQGSTGQGPKGGKFQRGPAHCQIPGSFMNYLGQINLSQAQKAKIFDIRLEHAKHRPQQFGEYHNKAASKVRGEIRQMIFSENFDKQKFEHYIDTMHTQHQHQAQQSMQHRWVKRAEYIHKQLSVLTAEQRSKLQELVAKSPCPLINEGPIGPFGRAPIQP